MYPKRFDKMGRTKYSTLKTLKIDLTIWLSLFRHKSIFYSPSTKVKEMQWKVVTGGRVNCGCFQVVVASLGNRNDPCCNQNEKFDYFLSPYLVF